MSIRHLSEARRTHPTSLNDKAQFAGRDRRPKPFDCVEYALANEAALIDEAEIPFARIAIAMPKPRNFGIDHVAFELSCLQDFIER